MVHGSTIDDKKGRLLFFRSYDREHWTYVNETAKESKFGWMWECPDYFEVDGTQLLIFSPMGFLKDGKADENQSICMQVSFDRESCRMELPDSYQFLDYGLDLYYFRVHPNIRAVYTKKIVSPADAKDGEYRLRFSLEDGEAVDVGGYRIYRNGEQIFTDRSLCESESD